MDPRTPGEIEATGTLPVAGEGTVPLTSATEPVAPSRPDWIDEARANLSVPGKYLAYEDSGRRIVVPVSREWTQALPWAEAGHVIETVRTLATPARRHRGLGRGLDVAEGALSQASA